MKMKDPNRQSVRVFLLEDNPDDVELELREMRKAYLSVAYDVARNRQEFREKLAGFSPDIILADYALPDITGIEAINICKAMGIDVPVILITEEGNESVAVDSLGHGAIDYILKRNIAGLPARLNRALEIWEDRKAKKLAEDEGIRLHQLLFENRKMEAIGRLAGGIAHDFNNILTGVMGNAEICLSDNPQDPDTQRRLEAIITISQRGADLVKQLLIFSRKMAMDFKAVDLNEFISETMHFFKRIVEETIEIRLDLYNDVLPVMCDPGQLTQALMNLILNARDAMPGTGNITIKTGRCLTAEAHFPEDQTGGGREWCACISISDTGSGIDERDLQRIFDPFFTTKEVGNGTGLGLTIVYSIVREHNGTVVVSSRKGGGTSFTIYLPFSDVKAESNDAQFYENIPAKESAGTSGTETILIVEDEDVLREMLSSYMRSVGYTVVTAHNGDEAIALYRDGPEKFHVVISDMLMPDKGGIELFQEISKVNPHARFILVTGYSLAEVDESVLAEMTAILKKPYTPMQIVKLVRDIFDA
jgi:signal transduction histidine kinase